jgi:prepilin-type N-terminal cleavage/methylation domain-containing protein
MMNNQLRRQLGFTLIELLTVMAIIVILVSISLIGLTGAKESARDAQRKSALEAIKSGIELYRSDCNNYPISTGGDFYTTFGSSLTGTDGGCSSSTSTSNNNVYISDNPRDPISTRNYYYYSPTGTTYIICAGLETGTTADTVCTGINANCGACVNCSYHVNNP